MQLRLLAIHVPQFPIRSLLAADLLVDPDCVILSRADHGVSANVYPEAHTLVALHPLENFLALDVPQNDASILARGGYERLVVQRAKAAANGKFLVLMALIRLLYAAGDVVPESYAVVEVESENKSPVRREADVCYGGVILMDQSAEALSCRRVPDSAAAC